MLTRFSNGDSFDHVEAMLSALQRGHIARARTATLKPHFKTQLRRWLRYNTDNYRTADFKGRTQPPEPLDLQLMFLKKKESIAFLLTLPGAMENVLKSIENTGKPIVFPNLNQEHIPWVMLYPMIVEQLMEHNEFIQFLINEGVGRFLSRTFAWLTTIPDNTLNHLFKNTHTRKSWLDAITFSTLNSLAVKNWAVLEKLAEDPYFGEKIAKDGLNGFVAWPMNSIDLDNWVYRVHGLVLTHPSFIQACAARGSLDHFNSAYLRCAYNSGRRDPVVESFAVKILQMMSITQVSKIAHENQYFYQKHIEAKNQLITKLADMLARTDYEGTPKDITDLTMLYIIPQHFHEDQRNDIIRQAKLRAQWIIKLSAMFSCHNTVSMPQDVNDLIVPYVTTAIQPDAREDIIERAKTRADAIVYQHQIFNAKRTAKEMLDKTYVVSDSGETPTAAEPGSKPRVKRKKTNRG